ncbi:hypothetical protein GCK32_008883 [Trichostrongylus colubriformis]|uniref:CCHC-type domain-containing protein n=1 Tax=Trichostrongylus colubriformis TaxID=6319 RepID=A0AAN8IWC4_TRICO
MVRVDAMERILSDQIDTTKDVYAELRTLRMTKNQQRQEENDSDHQELMSMLNVVLQSIEELTKKVENRYEVQQPAPPEPHEHARGDVERIKISEPGSKHEKSVLKFLQGVLEARMETCQMKIQHLVEHQPCRPRGFKEGYIRAGELSMGCVFCGARGKHSSDSCPEIADSKRRTNGKVSEILAKVFPPQDDGTSLSDLRETRYCASYGGKN